MAQQQRRKHFAITSTYTPPASQHPKAEPPKINWRAIARKEASTGHAGGRARCEVCFTMYAMSYMRLVQLTSFRQDIACLDCIDEHHFHVIKK